MWSFKSLSFHINLTVKKFIHPQISVSKKTALQNIKNKQQQIHLQHVMVEKKENVKIKMFNKFLGRKTTRPVTNYFRIINVRVKML